MKLIFLRIMMSRVSRMNMMRMFNFRGSLKYNLFFYHCYICLIELISRMKCFLIFLMMMMRMMSWRIIACNLLMICFMNTHPNIDMMKWRCWMNLNSMKRRRRRRRRSFTNNKLSNMMISYCFCRVSRMSRMNLSIYNP